jgi:hypothetical protein
MGYHDRRCPACTLALEDTADLEYTMPAQYRVVVGYCPSCSRRVEVSERGRIRWLSYSPVCRICRTEVRPDFVESDEGHEYWRCRAHPDQRWQYVPGPDTWTFLGPSRLSALPRSAEPPASTPGEILWRVQKGSDVFRTELRQAADVGVELQLLITKDAAEYLLHGQRYPIRALALSEADRLLDLYQDIGYQVISER